MGVNAVSFGGRTLIDIRDTTARASTILQGYTAYGADGNRIVGTAKSLNKITLAVTVPKSGWHNKSQTIIVSRVTSDSDVFIGASSQSQLEWDDCGVFCTKQAAGKLTLTCRVTPSNDLVANIILIL